MIRGGMVTLADVLRCIVRRFIAQSSPCSMMVTTGAASSPGPQMAHILTGNSSVFLTVKYTRRLRGHGPTYESVRAIRCLALRRRQ
jgi:hypothetical protein